MVKGKGKPKRFDIVDLPSDVDRLDLTVDATLFNLDFHKESNSKLTYKRKAKKHKLHEVLKDELRRQGHCRDVKKNYYKKKVEVEEAKKEEEEAAAVPAAAPGNTFQSDINSLLEVSKAQMLVGKEALAVGDKAMLVGQEAMAVGKQAMVLSKQNTEELGKANKRITHNEENIATNNEDIQNLGERVEDARTEAAHANGKCGIAMATANSAMRNTSRNASKLKAQGSKIDFILNSIKKNSFAKSPTSNSAKKSLSRTLFAKTPNAKNKAPPTNKTLVTPASLKGTPKQACDAVFATMRGRDVINLIDSPPKARLYKGSPKKDKADDAGM